ncbi:permeases of the major facilitator superfamily [Stylonychia lemnae]|uniref:Permeases of the major facilitator superfamily n=1 Tax=Stylonychia lemnae TaxID=5949 RepID=A0A078B426_STYLE|nr:permeases of the major facilitator superfamily [Stylonychia lemnae]|eukprot:CDW88996.1 permeases of the major facilitator superfamily [Stylonychia lemnae]
MSMVSDSFDHPHSRHHSLHSEEDKKLPPAVKESITGEKRRMIITMIIAISSTWTLYGNIATFYPPYRLEHHDTITDTQVGIVLALFEGGVLLSSPFIAHTLMVFFILSLALRLLQGAGDTCISTACLSLISSEFPSRREEFVGYAEGAIGAGLMLGPVIGQALYTLLGFEYTFYCTSAILMLPFLAVLQFIPSQYNRSSDDRAGSMTSSQRLEKSKEIRLRMLLTNKRVIVAALSSIFAMIFLLFFDTILSDQLLDMGISKDLVGYIYSVSCLVYSIVCPFVGYICKKIHKIYVLQIAIILSAISLYFFGPSKILGFSDSLGLMIFGMSLLGVSCALIFVPLLGEIIEAVQEKENIASSNDQLNDKASSLFNMAYAVGCLIAPILGGLFNDLVGFRSTCDIMAIAATALAILYFLFNALPFWIYQRQKKQEDEKIKLKYGNISQKDKLILNKVDQDQLLLEDDENLEKSKEYEKELWHIKDQNTFNTQAEDNTFIQDSIVHQPRIIDNNG